MEPADSDNVAPIDDDDDVFVDRQGTRIPYGKPILPSLNEECLRDDNESHHHTSALLASCTPVSGIRRPAIDASVAWASSLPAELWHPLDGWSPSLEQRVPRPRSMTRLMSNGGVDDSDEDDDDEILVPPYRGSDTIRGGVYDEDEEERPVVPFSIDEIMECPLTTRMPDLRRVLPYEERVEKWEAKHERDAPPPEVVHLARGENGYPLWGYYTDVKTGRDAIRIHAIAYADWPLFYKFWTTPTVAERDRLRGTYIRRSEELMTMSTAEKHGAAIPVAIIISCAMQVGGEYAEMYATESEFVPRCHLSALKEPDTQDVIESVYSAVPLSALHRLPAWSEHHVELGYLYPLPGVFAHPYGASLIPEMEKQSAEYAHLDAPPSQITHADVMLL